jgi:hypothetical protein
MTIHSHSPQPFEDEGSTDCKINLTFSRTSLSIYALDFYNYFHHGVDFLISGQTHIVRKIIIHSNVVRCILVFLLEFI